MLSRGITLRCALQGLQSRTREDAGQTLRTELSKAEDVAQNRAVKAKKEKRASKKVRIAHGRALQEKRLELIEQGKAIPHELKPVRQRQEEMRVKMMEDKEPGALRDLQKMLKDVPERRQYRARMEYCTQINSYATHTHPVLLGRWWDVLRATPQGLLRHHVRELAPLLEYRMHPSQFHNFYETSDIEVLKQKGYVFEGRDGEPLKLTNEELRQTREADLYAKTDPKFRAFLRFQHNRRQSAAKKSKNKGMRDAPYFAPLAYSEGDALAYLGYRLFPIYAVMLRIFGEISLRAPKFAPRSMLDFGAGFGTSTFTALEVWKGIAVPKRHDRMPPREQAKLLRYETHDQRHNLTHPRLADADVRALLGGILEKEATALEKKAAKVEAQVAKGRLPSGSEVDALDAARERRSLLSDEVWKSTEKWKGNAAELEAELGLDEDFLGEGMYAGKETKAFEETDYFLEKDHTAYPKPEEAAALEARGINPGKYLRWFRGERMAWADAYYKHVEKAKMERDPSYRPLSAEQYLEARSGAEQPDKTLPSVALHADDADELENKAAVYKDWDKRAPEILSTIIAVEPSRAMMNFGLDMLSEVAPHIRWKKFLTEGGSAAEQQDLVVASYTLSELSSEQLRADAVRALWEKCSGVLVIVEAGTGSGFKLVLDARRTILDEYVNIGPWEFQPTVLAPCPHDQRCPVEHSLQGRRFPNLRTCHATARYRQSFVEKWATENPDFERDETYSYVVIARNEVIPEKAQRRVADYKPTIVGEDPKKMASDERVKKVRRKLEEDKVGIAGDNRVYIKPKGRTDLYPADDFIPYPKTELNMNPFVGRWSSYGQLRTAKDILSMHKERAEYYAKFRERSWVYNRLVRPVKLGASGHTQVVDVCTPHGTQERLLIETRKRADFTGDLVARACPGALIPNYARMKRYEWVQGDNPNTFAPATKTLSPLEIEETERGLELTQENDRQQMEDEEQDADAVAVRRSVEARLKRARSGDAAAVDEIRRELRGMKRL